MQTDDEQLADQFERHRPRLRAIAYRMLGSLTEADDAVQDTWLRLSRAAEGVENLGGWLTTTVARVCLNMLRARKTRREEPLEVYVPDPVVSPDAGSQPEEQLLLVDSVEVALLIVFDTLMPDERLAFVLHDMFDVPFKEIALVVGRTPAATKQLASRARRRVKDAAIPTDADRSRQREAIDAFFAAARAGDFDALLRVLHPEIQLRIDAGRERAEASMLIRGSAAVADQAITGIRQMFAAPGATLRAVLVNGSAGVVVLVDEHPLTVISFAVTDGMIARINAINEPGRVRRLTAAVLAPD